MGVCARGRYGPRGVAVCYGGVADNPRQYAGIVVIVATVDPDAIYVEVFNLSVFEIAEQANILEVRRGDRRAYGKPADRMLAAIKDPLEGVCIAPYGRPRLAVQVKVVGQGYGRALEVDRGKRSPPPPSGKPPFTSAASPARSSADEMAKLPDDSPSKYHRMSALPFHAASAVGASARSSARVMHSERITEIPFLPKVAISPCLLIYVQIPLLIRAFIHIYTQYIIHDTTRNGKKFPAQNKTRKQTCILNRFKHRFVFLAEDEGFEPPWDCSLTVFKTVSAYISLHKSLYHYS
ncbi:hypothetical protein LJC34_02580 [Oscillospiraceae bacterium OttesenSCG-928-G22]|nr:hypothetical protein [Oscillospiraceae bacterium OttesenSCG-928-G22]